MAADWVGLVADHLYWIVRHVGAISRDDIDRAIRRNCPFKPDTAYQEVPVIRCWQCRKIIIVPDRVIPDSPMYSQSATAEVICGSCGSVYTITTTRMPGRAVVPKPKPVTEAEAEKDKIWKR